MKKEWEGAAFLGMKEEAHPTRCDGVSRQDLLVFQLLLQEFIEGPKENDECDEAEGVPLCQVEPVEGGGVCPTGSAGTQPVRAEVAGPRSLPRLG